MRSPSSKSIRYEVKAMSKTIDDQNKRKIRPIIAIVRPESVYSLERKCSPSRWKFWKEKTSLIFVTTEDGLQNAIVSVCQKPSRPEVIILASSHIARISYDVPGHARSLILLRCGPSGKLLVTGSSTFNGVRMDTWQEKERKDNKLYVGSGVGIEYELAQIRSWRGTQGSNISYTDQESLRSHVRGMNGAEMKGNWWREWRGTVATILGLVVSAGTLVINLKATAGGIFVEYKLGIMSVKVAAGAVKTSALVTAAGPAVLLGAGVAAAVYFVPWDKVFSWMKSFFSRIWDWICDLCEKFANWKSEQAQRSKARPTNTGRAKSMPMEFF